MLVSCATQGNRLGRTNSTVNELEQCAQRSLSSRFKNDQNCAVGAGSHYLRRMKAKLGPKGATMATAHKIAVIFYTMVKNQVQYDETLWDTRDAQREKRFEAKLKRQAEQLGYELVPIEPKAA
jgi:hypothetical protein